MESVERPQSRIVYKLECYFLGLINEREREKKKDILNHKGDSILDPKLERLGRGLGGGQWVHPPGSRARLMSVSQWCITWIQCEDYQEACLMVTAQLG